MQGVCHSICKNFWRIGGLRDYTERLPCEGAFSVLPSICRGILLFLFFRLDQMPYRQDGVVEDHPRAAQRMTWRMASRIWGL